MQGGGTELVLNILAVNTKFCICGNMFFFFSVQKILNMKNVMDKWLKQDHNIVLYSNI